jgi:hypothetical protein
MGYMTAVQRQIRAACSSCHAASLNLQSGQSSGVARQASDTVGRPRAGRQSLTLVALRLR